uniref:Secreted protein n=1 Tax=Salix viminalis TaxID=40686 RepID=A0A6N2LB59_SALVM
MLSFLSLLFSLCILQYAEKRKVITHIPVGITVQPILYHSEAGVYLSQLKLKRTTTIFLKPRIYRSVKKKKKNKSQTKGKVEKRKGKR